jgi:hypothetical protein
MMAPDQISMLIVFLNRLGELLSGATQGWKTTQELGVLHHTREAKIVCK